jgi:hypothetical protein
MFEYLAACTTIIGFILVLSAEADKNVKDASRRHVVHFIEQTSLSEVVRKWPHSLIIKFDAVFSPNIASLRFFFFSCIFSLSTCLLLIVAGIGIRTSLSAEDYLGLVIPILGNMVPDYLSYIETRFMLVMISRQRNYSAQVFLLMLDAILSLAIFFFFAVIGNYIFMMYGALMVSSEYIEFYQAFHFILDQAFYLFNLGLGYFFYSVHTGAAFDFSTIDVSSKVFYVVTTDRCAVFAFGTSGWVSPFLYSTFVTSIWIWLYMASLFLLKFFLLFDESKKFALTHLDIENRPFSSIGFVMAIIAAAAAMIGIAFLPLDGL